MTPMPLPYRVRRSFLCFLVACTTSACVSTDAEDPPSSETSGDASDDASEEASATDDPTDDPTAVDTTGDDPTGVDTTGDDPTDPTGDPTGEDAVALGDDVLFFVREIDATDDDLWMYDVGTDTAERVLDLGTAEITSIAIAPGRGAIAFATTYDSIDYQSSERIMALVHGADGFGEPEVIMPAIPTPIGVGSGYSQRLDDLSWHPDGSAIWFGHSFFADISEPGGSALGRADVASGGFELFIDGAAGCAVNAGSSIAPDGSTLVAWRDICTSDVDQGLVAYVLPVDQPQVIVPTQSAVYSSPRWSADGSGLAYAASIDYDSDGDGTNDIYGHAILLIDIATAEQYVVLAPSPDAHIWSFAMSPDATRFVACVNQAGARNLLLVDYSGDEPTTRWLTDDGVSCDPSW
jgi:Tol biopolymer transport system component